MKTKEQIEKHIQEIEAEMNKTPYTNTYVQLLVAKATLDWVLEDNYQPNTEEIEK